MITLTNSEVAKITYLVREIKKEEQRPVRRKNRITNLVSHISVIIGKAQRRKPKYPTLLER